jgi:hypothetical protein
LLIYRGVSRTSATRSEKVSSGGNTPISVILVNAIIFIVISLLREDPLSSGILDMFFLKIFDHSYLKLREFILKISPKFLTILPHQILSVGIGFDPVFSVYQPDL